jgi:hypothetical protein
MAFPNNFCVFTTTPIQLVMLHISPSWYLGPQMITKEFREPSSIHAIPMQNVTKTQEQKKKSFLSQKKILCLIGGKQPNNTILPFFSLEPMLYSIFQFIYSDHNIYSMGSKWVQFHMNNCVYAIPSKGFKKLAWNGDSLFIAIFTR